MTDLDFDRLGDVWRRQPDPAEMERLQRTAAAVSKRARLAQIVDVVASLAVAGVVVLLVLANPGSATVVMGVAAILVLLAGNVRQRKLRQVELRSLAGGTEDMLDQSIERIETTLRHNRFSLIGIGPALLLASLFAATVERPAEAMLGSLADLPYFRALWVGGWLIALVGSILYIRQSMRRSGRELERLTAMRESYRQEGESSAP